MGERLWILLAKQKCGEATTAELFELEDLLKNENLNGHSKETIDRLWEKSLMSSPEINMDENSWNRIQRKINYPVSKLIPFYKFSKKWIAAAIILLIAGASFFIVHSKFPGESLAGVSQKKLNTISTPPASKTKIQLPDGTQVWLNGSSQVVYNTVSFGAKNREISLIGEGFFDVVHNSKIPFIIHAENVTITVKGTAFNVKAYPEQKTIETTLIRGLIEITTTQDPERKIIVKPNEKIIIPVEKPVDTNNTKVDSAESPLYTISRLQKNEKQVLSETAWMKDKLEFDNETFDDLAPEFESWFSVTIHLGDEAIKQKRFSGSINKETLQETLGAMQLSYPFTYRISGNEVWINQKKK
ncbi:MAG: FecR family protein [Ginsengibacter sp.]